jgi:O-antigen/teichoic acid export membrane protein
MLSVLQKEKLFSLADALHQRFFGVEMSGGVKVFLGSLTWSFLGGIVGAVIIFVVSIFAGRYLGPEEYGKYSLVVAMAGIFILPMLAGIDTALVHFLSKYATKRKEYVSSGLWIVGLLSLGITCILFIFSSEIAVFFSTETTLFRVAIVISIVLAVRNILDAVARGYQDFRYQSAVKVVEALTIFGIFIFGYFSNQSTYLVVAVATLGGYFISSLIYIWRYRLSIGIQKTHTKSLLSYGKFVFLGFIFTATMSSLDKVFINKYIGAEDLGLYNAYYTVSTLLIGQIIILLINVVFPFLSATNDSNGKLLRRFNKLAIFAFIPLVIGCMGVARVGISFFGASYYVDWLLIALFSCYSALLMYFSILWAFIASRSQEGFRFTALQGLIGVLIFVGVTLICQTFLTIELILSFLILSLLYATIIGNLYYKKYAQVL